MNEKPKHEELIVPKGKTALLRKAISMAKRENPKLKKLLKALPPIQTLSRHSYYYVPTEYVQQIVDRYNELHYEAYGWF